MQRGYNSPVAKRVVSVSMMVAATQALAQTGQAAAFGSVDDAEASAAAAVTHRPGFRRATADLIRHVAERLGTEGAESVFRLAGAFQNGDATYNNGDMAAPPASTGTTSYGWQCYGNCYGNGACYCCGYTAPSGTPAYSGSNNAPLPSSSQPLQK